MRPVLAASAIWFGVGMTASACARPIPVGPTPPLGVVTEPVRPEQHHGDTPLVLYLDDLEDDLDPSYDGDAADGTAIIGFDDGPVPPFFLRAANGVVVDSRALVGREPFVVVFFATRCPVCSIKLALVSHVLREAGPIRTLWVHAGACHQASRAMSFLGNYDVTTPVIDAYEHPLFAFAYNPFRGVPVVAVVGRGGGLIEYQLGLEANDPARLARAIDFARREPPAEAFR